MIKSGSTRKYMLYAIGEIALVVIGILIALQINNWNQNNKDSTLLDQYYTNILADLQQTLDFMDRAIYLEGLFSEKANKSLAELKQPEDSINLDSLELWLTQMVGTVTFRIIDDSFESIKSSGHLSLIKDPELKNELTRYYGEIKRVEKMIDKNNAWLELTFGDYIRNNEVGFYYDRSGTLKNDHLKLPRESYRLSKQLNTKASNRHFKALRNMKKKTEELIISIQSVQ